MKRREMIKKLGLSAGLTPFSPAVLSLFQNCQNKENQYEWIPLYFTEKQGAFLKKLINTLLPGTESLPSATEVNLHFFIDDYFSDILPEKIAKQHTETIQNLVEEVDNQDFSSENIKKILSTYLVKQDASPSINYSLVKNILGEDIAQLSADEKKIVVVKGILELCIWGYQISEKVGKNIMAYDPIPGEHIGCVPLSQISNGKAWSLNKSWN